MPANTIRRFPARSGGFVLIAAALTFVLLIGILGLVQDLARMYVAKNELQAFADAASMAAAMELNGTEPGIQHARDAVRDYHDLDKWNFHTAQPENVLIEFAVNRDGPYNENPGSPVGVRFVRVKAEGALRLYFMPGFSETAPLGMLLFTIGREQTLRAAATSGQLPVTRFWTNLLPYSPDAHDSNDANFGYKKGSLYTLRWPPLGQRPDPENPPPPGSRKYENWCQGDREAGYATSNGSSERGFIDIGQIPGSGGSAYIREAILNSVQTHDLGKGDPILNVSGNRGVESEALRERFFQDSDTISENYIQYLAKLNDSNSPVKGNGRRLAVVPVNNPANDTVVDFALFYLREDVCGDADDNTASCCGEYVGAALVPGRRAADPDSGAYKVRLLP